MMLCSVLQLEAYCSDRMRSAIRPLTPGNSMLRAPSAWAPTRPHAG